MKPKGPVRGPSHDHFDDFDEQGHNLIGSLHLEADDEPIRRGVNASRANSVRFDESTLQGANWGQSSRHSGDFGIRPSSGFGNQNMMERSLSHKSDGRHSSAGHSVHSIHSAPSGRASSLGLDTNFAVGSGDEESLIDIPEPPPGFFVLGTVPSIFRCWLTENFSRDTLLYAVACTGSQKSTIDYSLVKELNLGDQISRDTNGIPRICIPVFLTEAIVTQSSPRTNGVLHERPIPSITTQLEVTNFDQAENMDFKVIRVVLGSDTLRAHSADLLFSRNMMILLGDKREKLAVPFVRPEDESVFKHLATTNIIPGKPKLNANAAPFISNSASAQADEKLVSSLTTNQIADETLSPVSNPATQLEISTSIPSENGGDDGHQPDISNSIERKRETLQEWAAVLSTSGNDEIGRRDSNASVMWGSWRQQAFGGGGSRDNNGSGSFQAGQRTSRSMKVLKSSKLTSSARTGSSYEPPLSSRTNAEAKRKSTGPSSDNEPPTPIMRWDSKDQKRTSAGSSDAKGDSRMMGASLREGREPRISATRSTNPIGGASAFKWMSSSGGGSKAPTAVAD